MKKDIKYIDSICICILENECTHPSSNFMVVGIISATSNVCPNDVDVKNPVVTDEKC
jgi:hypothetical protein